MHVLKLKLKANQYQKQMLEKRFRCMWHIHNEVVKYAQKQLNKLWHDRRYLQAVKQYRKNKDDIRENCELRVRLDVENKELTLLMNSLIRKYHLVKTDMEKFAKVQAQKFSHLVSSQQVQKEVLHVMKGVEKVLYAEGRHLHFKKLRNMDTISGKSPTNGVRYYDRYHTQYYPKKVTPAYDAEIEYLGLQICVDVDYSSDYITQSLNGEIAYCELKRILFNDGYHYYVNLYIKGRVPDKPDYEARCQEQGMDIGVSTVAVVSDDAAILEELAPRSGNYETRIKKLQKRIDVSKRILNPDNFNGDGTCKKGHLTWNISKSCRKKMRTISVLYRKKASYVEHSHYVLAKKILQNGSIVYTEAMNFKGLQKRSKKTEREQQASALVQSEGTVKLVKKFRRKKRFGHTLSNKAPSRFLDILKLKAVQYGGFVKEVNTYSFKATQYRHDLDKCEKLSLKQRFKTVDGREVQRDLYSAFLLRNTNPGYTAADRNQCKAKFSSFVTMSNNLISRMKKQGKSMPACFGF